MAKVEYDDDIIAAIDEEMGWIEEDGSSPSKTARDLGVHCKFMDGPFGATAWVGPDKVWSLCSLTGIHCTLLARSFSALEKLYKKLLERMDNPEKWQSYYTNMWKRRYRKWVCSREKSCNCQLCNIERSEREEKE